MHVNLMIPTDQAIATDPTTVAQQAMQTDLNLPLLARKIAANDPELEQLLSHQWRHPLTDETSLAYRQATVADALANPQWAAQLYAISQRVIHQIQNDNWRFPNGSATYQLYSLSNCMTTYLAGITDLLPLSFTGHSPAGVAFTNQLQRLFTPTKLHAMRQVIAACQQPTGYSYQADLQGDLGCTPHALDWHPAANKFTRLLTTHHHKDTFEVPTRDDNAAQAMSHDENLAAQSAATILTNLTQEFATFFAQLRYQSGLLTAIVHYVALLKGHPMTNLIFEPTTTIKGLVNLQLLLLEPRPRPLVANDLKIARHQPVLISGANQGGKTTFLRAIGLAQVLGQTGFPVPATRFASPAYHAVLTHFRREEDPHSRHGKLAEELARMREIVTDIQPPTLILMNESFSSTNEHEGALINEEIIRGLVSCGHTICAVTHQYELGQRLLSLTPAPCFLRAERLFDGQRSYRLVPGQPRLTSYGLDIFTKIFQPDLTVSTPSADKSAAGR